MFPILHLTEFCSHPSMMLDSYKSDGFILVLLVGCYRKSSASGDLMGKNQKLMFFFFLFLLSLSVFFFSLSPPFPPPPNALDSSVTIFLFFLTCILNLAFSMGLQVHVTSKLSVCGTVYGCWISSFSVWLLKPNQFCLTPRIYLTGQWRVVYSHEVSSVQLVSHLFPCHTCAPCVTFGLCDVGHTFSRSDILTLGWTQLTREVEWSPWLQETKIPSV